MGYFSYLLFMLPALIISMIAQARVQSTFHKYSQVRNARGLTGADAARRVLTLNGITNVQVEYVNGRLTDHYDPRVNVIRLSESVFGVDSVSAVGVAAHEAGHAAQYAAGYFPIKLRSALVPVSQFGSGVSIPLILLGYFFQYDWLIFLGIAFFSFAVLFSIVTLPVEFNASRRAIQVLGDSGTLQGEELEGAKQVLSAAAMTYVASTLTALLSLLRLILIFGRRNSH
ncbi:MAG: zinc metallopeptidase [Clostridiales bacterium]|jgi:Zn-dependent membrane protease YugP|nr:zinc metallopeptidase [Clostridiales bacterium]